MKAAILAGGLGTRLRSVVSDRPKPMALVGDTPFLEYLLRWLRDWGVSDIVLCVGHQWSTIRDYFLDGQRLEIRITYSVESEPLGTGGALKAASSFLTSTFLVLNGDSYLDLNIIDLLVWHRTNASLATLAVSHVPDVSSAGSVQVGDGDRITSFREKSTEVSCPGWVNAGVYVFEPDVLALLPERRRASLEYDLFPDMVLRELPVYAYRAAGQFLDIGTPARYLAAQAKLKGVECDSQI